MTLLEEIQAKCTPALIASRDCDAIATAVNAGRKKLQPRLISERGVRAALGWRDGATLIRFLKELSEASAADNVPGWLTTVLSSINEPVENHVLMLDTLGCGYPWLKTEAGLDLGDAETRILLDLIAAGNSSLAASCAKLKDLAVVDDHVTEYDIRKACWSDNGEYLA